MSLIPRSFYRQIHLATYMEIGARLGRWSPRFYFGRLEEVGARAALCSFCSDPTMCEGIVGCPWRVEVARIFICFWAWIWCCSLLSSKSRRSCWIIVSYGKSRVSPISFVTIPRLELQGALAGVRLAKLVCQELNLPMSAVTFWTDSMTVFQWINSKTYKFQIK